jgi:hypothetical protein
MISAGRDMLKVLALACCIVLTGCYEGWEAETVAGPQDPDPGPDQSIKPVYYILYQPIYLNADGINDPGCFPEDDVRVYRQNEWSSRSASLQKAMTDLAEKVVTVELGVSADDCDTLLGIRNAAIASAPWGAEEPGTDPLGRPMFHVKAVFYDGEPLSSPPSVVRRQDWEAFQDLVFAGRDARSRHVFVLANPVDGYFSEWRDSLDESVRLDGTPINDVDPTPDGIATRDSIIASDAASFSSWLLQ